MTTEEPSREAGEEEVQTQVSKLDASLVGKRVSLNGQIVSEQSQKALPRSLIIRCARCDGLAEVDLSKPENQSLLEAVLFKDKENLRRRAEACLIDKVGAQCFRKAMHRIRVEEEGFMNYAVLGVRDLLEEVEKFDQQVYRSRRVHLVRVKAPPSKKVRLRGLVVVDPSTRDLCVLADDVEALETQVAGFMVTDEDRVEWPRWFNGQRDITTQLCPDMVGRQLVQRAYLLALHTVPEIPDIHGRPIRGCLRILCFGDTKTYKSESAKDLTNHYGLGGFIVAESSSRTGITYAIDTEDRAIVWGELPNNDLGLTVIDGMHAMFAEEMKELRESLENQRVIVRRSVSGEALARTRVIGILNPNKGMNQYMYPSMAVKDNPAFYDPPDITRWDLFLPFAKEDVSEEEVAGRKPGERPVPEECFKRHVYWAWSRRPEHIRYTEEAKGLIVEGSIELMKQYALSNLPIVHFGVRDVLCRLSVAQACQDDSTDETHSLVIVDITHVEKVLETYRDMLDRLRLKEYRLEEEGRLDISPSEFEEMVGTLTKRQLVILNSIKIHSKSSTILAEELDVSVDTIQRDYKTLRRYGLINTTPRVGVTLTARGVQFLKSLKQRNILIPAKNEDIQIFLSVGDKIKLVYDKATELAVEGLVSKFDVAEALQNCIDRSEVFHLLDKLEEEGKLAKKNVEHYVMVKGDPSEAFEEATREQPPGWEWEGFHVIGSYTPDVAYEKTVKSLRHLQKKQTLTRQDILQAIAYYWTDESYPKVLDRLLKGGVIDKELHLISTLKAQWTQDLTQEEILERLTRLGLTPAKAKDLFDVRLAGVELLWYDRNGKTAWKWV